MVSFRRLVLAIAVLALFTGLASAQVAIGGGSSSGGSLVCTANVAAPTQVRAEGHTELLGDIEIACTGGSLLAPGAAVPTVNITVALAQTYITSRVFSTSSGLSEALLLIDEPNGLPGSTAGFPLTVCTTTAGGTTPSQVGAGPGGCATVAGTATPTAPAGPAAYAAVLPGTTTVPNVFEGIVPQFPGGSNQVVFNGIPLLAPVSSGVARVFRITNLRAAASLLPSGGAFQGTTPIYASVSVSGSGLLLQQSNLVTANVFTGLNPNTTIVRNATGNGNGSSIVTGGSVGPLLQCQSLSLGSTNGAAVLRFGEGFSSAFKTRVTPTAAVTGAGTTGGSLTPALAASFTQNVPGANYQGSESGFIYPLPNSNVAGLADFGTRLKATFSNIPTGVTVYVTTTNINPTGAPTNTNLVAGGTTTNTINSSIGALAGGASSGLLASLVIGETAGAQGTVGGQLGVLPTLPATTNQNGLLLTALTPDANGTATAVWEVLAADPTATQAAEFGVFYSFTGNQVAGTPQTTPAATVSMSFAPTSTTFSGISSIPRFTGSQTSTTLINVSLCQTTLLFPFVNSAPGFDTGISIANTSADVSPFSTKNQNGACTLNFFGNNIGTKTAFAFPSDGTNITPGTQHAEQVSNIVTAQSGFTGYVIAVCNFQYAHGYALFSDTGIRNWATGYLGLVIPGPTSRTAPESLMH